MEEQDIYKEGNLFVIKKEIEGKMITFGSFDTLEEAIIERDELEEYGWPYLPEEPEEKLTEMDYGQYISKKDNQFIVSRIIRGKEKIFGIFEYLDDAKEYKYRLIENAWDDSFRNSNIGPYGRFIYKEGRKFVINRNIRGTYTRFGSYNTLDEAILAREKLIEDNWGVEGELNPYKKGYYGDFIVYARYHYYINKTIDGEEYNFGIFDNLENAIIARDILIENDWDDTKVPENLYSWRFFATYNPRYKAWNIKNFVNFLFIDFGLFYYKNAKEAIRLLIDNDWDASCIPLELYHPFSNIRYFNRRNEETFIVYRKINEEFIPYETFDNYDDALEKRDSLLLSNWIEEEDLGHEEKIEDHIYLINDMYFVKNDLYGETLLFGVFENIMDAVDKRLECIKNKWQVPSIPDFTNKLTNLPNNYYRIPITFDIDSLENHSFYLDRIYADELLPFIPHEYYSFISTRYRKVPCKLKIYLKLNYFDNYYLQQYLEELVLNKEYSADIHFNLQLGSYPNYEDRNIFIKKNDLFIENNILPIPREYFLEEVPISGYEFFCNFHLNNINCYGQLNLEFRIEILDDNYYDHFSLGSDICLSLSKEDDKLICLDIFDVYNSFKGDFTPGMPLSYAKNFGAMIGICEMLYNYYSVDKIKGIMKLGPRQFNDYFKQAKYLNLLEGDFKNPTLTDQSLNLFSLDIKEKNKEILAIMLKHKPFYDLFSLCKEKRELPNQNDAFLILKNYILDKPDNRINTSANRLLTWLEWLVNESYNFFDLK